MSISFFFSSLSLVSQKFSNARMNRPSCNLLLYSRFIKTGEQIWTIFLFCIYLYERNLYKRSVLKIELFYFLEVEHIKVTPFYVPDLFARRQTSLRVISDFTIFVADPQSTVVSNIFPSAYYTLYVHLSNRVFSCYNSARNSYHTIQIKQNDTQ